LQVKIPVLAALVVLTTVLAIPLATHPTAGNVGLNPGDAGNTWYVYGPNAGAVTRLQYTYYNGNTGGTGSEFQDFELGNLDLTDWPTDDVHWASAGCTDATNPACYDAHPDFLQTPRQGQFGDFGFYFNGASSRFTRSQEAPGGAANGPFWGCDWNDGLTSTSFTVNKQTYTSQCGIYQRQAFGHLFDRATFSANRELANLVCPSPVAKDPSCAPLQVGQDGLTVAQQCAWDTLNGGSACIDAYRIAPSGGDGQQPVGSPDFCRAADLMIASLTPGTQGTTYTGPVPTKASGTCVLNFGTGGVPSTFTANKFRAMIRSTQPRRDMGNEFMASLNALFGATVVVPQYGTINTIGHPIVFSDPPKSPIDDWDMYTYGYQLPGPYPDHMHGLYNSQGATTYCGGLQSVEPNDPQFVCLPSIDAATAAASTAPCVKGSTTGSAFQGIGSRPNDANIYCTTASGNKIDFNTATTASFNDWGANAVDLPVFAQEVRTAALRSEGGLVNQLGQGYYTPSLTFAGQSSYTPSNSLYRFGGGDPTKLRWGQLQGTSEFNIFQAQSVWEFQAIGQIYDVLTTNSPVQPGNVFCWMCANYQTSTDSAGNEHFLVELRQNLRFQDGSPVTAWDVKFTYQNFRDAAPATVGGNFFNMLNIKVLDSTHLDVAWLGASISYPLFMGNYVIPAKYWVPSDCSFSSGSGWSCTNASETNPSGIPLADGTNAVYGDVPVVDAAKLDPSYDPLTAGTLIGSGAYECLSVFTSDLGKLGTGCAQNSDGSRATQALGLSAKLFLQAFLLSPSASDPFAQYMRSFDATWSTGSGVAAEKGQFQEFSYADQAKTGTVTISDLASVGACFGNSGTATSGCNTAAYTYWHRSAFESTPGTISGEVAIVASHLDDALTSPFSPSPSVLLNIAPYP